MRLYELTTVYPLEEDQYQAGRDQVLADLAAQGVEIVKTGDPIDRDLAYEVQKRRRARYVLYNLNIEPEKITLLDRSFKLNANLLKYLFVRVEQ
ncbi:MAG: 30S ribosomal protein S6 [Spirochaetaceae bacterium]|jgi:small subunit ribosomal protein S6|nr:30S ribosomal protein S6 [Spirochaetaceae bacterium]